MFFGRRCWNSGAANSSINIQALGATVKLNVRTLLRLANSSADITFGFVICSFGKRSTLFSSEVFFGGGCWFFGVEMQLSNMRTSTNISHSLVC